jgi:hypothetical protein
MTEVEQLAFRKVWGHVLLVSLKYPDDEQVQKSFQVVHEICRELGLLDGE